MKWQIVLEVQLHGAPDDIERALDNAMNHLEDLGIQDPSVGASLSSGFSEIEFVVDAETFTEAQRSAESIIAKVLGAPGEIIGASARQALVPA